MSFQHDRYTGCSLALCLSIVVGSWLSGVHAVADETQFDREVLPILKSHCVRCHGAEKQEGGVRLDTLSVNLVDDRAALEQWHEVLNVLQKSEMPPEGEMPLSSQQLQTLTDWVSSSVHQALEARRQTDGRVVMRRLNRFEYQNTMRDLLGLDMDYSRDLPPDAVSSDGFQNNGRSLQMSSLQFEYYLATARRAMDRVIVRGEQPRKFDYVFPESNVDEWLGDAQRSNRLGRRQEFLAKMVNDYPDDGDFLVRVRLSAELKPETGYPLLEVSVGYRPDTEILMQEFELVEITSSDSQTFEFRGRLENFPLPVRGQGKYPGLVVRVRNVYDDKSPLPAAQKDDKGRTVYPDEPHLPTLTIESVEFHGNAYDQWPPELHRRILYDSPGVDREEIAYVTELLRRFMTRAFRRTVEDAEVARFAAFYQSIRAEFPSFEETIREALAMILVQPDFLFLLEPAGEEKRTISEQELASRLSYFLWSTMPDDRLLELANAGTLRENLDGEVDRMLADRRAQRFSEQFTDQWLSLNVVDNIAVNRERYPDFDDRLKSDLCDETHQMFEVLLRENQSAIQLLSSDFTMLNEPLAKHYGVPGVLGRSFRRVALPAELHRGSILSHGSVLLSNSTGADSHPVRRAVWIRDRILNDPPAPPPPNVPTLEEANPEFHQLSVREQLEIHRSRESCNNCHRNIDAWGIALENFDAVGRWRSEIQRRTGDNSEMRPVDAVVELPGGRQVIGADGLRAYLAGDRRQDFARSLISRLFTYALGRSLELSDQDAVDDVLNQFTQDDYRLKGLVHKVIGSDLFQTK
ncbi:MAG: DUF1592 domain-containing protein [Planctomyces sp.]|nr:DUF1592 domain-containing protein [Planctomyces sp.]